MSNLFQMEAAILFCGGHHANETKQVRGRTELDRGGGEVPKAEWGQEL